MSIDKLSYGVKCFFSMKDMSSDSSKSQFKVKVIMQSILGMFLDMWIYSLCVKV